MARHSKTGATTSAIETSPAKKKRLEKKRRAEEKSWAKKSGPVKTYFVDPDSLK